MLNLQDITVEMLYHQQEQMLGNVLCNKTVEDVWKCASTAAVAYYMDPRNSLNENYIFQFEQLTYDEKNQTKRRSRTYT